MYEYNKLSALFDVHVNIKRLFVLFFIYIMLCVHVERVLRVGFSSWAHTRLIAFIRAPNLAAACVYEVIYVLLHVEMILVSGLYI